MEAIMKILYRQPQKDDKDRAAHVPFECFGIEKCYLKQILSDHDGANCIKSYHFHTGYEFHLIVQGKQTYETAEGCYPVESGHFLMVPQNKKHKIVETAPHTCKYAITFAPNPENAAAFADASNGDCVCKRSPKNCSERFNTFFTSTSFRFRPPNF